MGAVGWIVRQRHPTIVPHPLAYMDNAYGLDISGETMRYEHHGEAQIVPLAQGRMLEVWDELGLAWKWRKALSGCRLTITGIVVDLDKGTLELEDGTVKRFVATVPAFLAVPSRQPALRDWRRIVGWANWALTVRPRARPLLSLFYIKLARLGLPYAIMFRNKATDAVLCAFVRELELGKPLSMRDPMLTEWSEADADAFYLTDACLKAMDGTGSGLGFFAISEQQHRHSSSRPRVCYKLIQFAEALAVYSAI